MRKSLLPPNATAQERVLGEAISRISDIPISIDALWNPQSCPTSLLPWLAWALSVDEWDILWTEEQKRNAVASAVEIHRHKGTRGALDRAISALGYRISIVEWWEEETPRERGTFRVVVEVDNRGLDAALTDSLSRIVLRTKNTRSHLSEITISGSSAGVTYCGLAAQHGLETTIYPYLPETVDVSGQVGGFGASCASYETITIQPEA